MSSVSYDRLYMAFKLLIEAGEKKAAAGDTRQDNPAAAAQPPTHAAQASTAYHAQTGGAK